MKFLAANGEKHIKKKYGSTLASATRGKPTPRHGLNFLNNGGATNETGRNIYAMLHGSSSGPQCGGQLSKDAGE